MDAGAARGREGGFATYGGGENESVCVLFQSNKKQKNTKEQKKEGKKE